MESKRITRHIDRLLLDPNNYRFIDRSDYQLVPDQLSEDNRIQQRTFNFIVGKNNENIKDLISSFTTNGFLDIDQIQVKPIGDKYLVLEGNRRTATLKYLYEEYKKGNDVGRLEEADFKSVEVVEIIGEDPSHHLITMGLHHISGKKRWSAVNEAQLVTDLIYEHQKTENEVCDSLGITKYKLRKSVRTLSLIEQFKKSDFGDQFRTEMYYTFESVIGNPKMREWIQWNDNDYLANNTNNLNRFFSWISETEEVERDEDGMERSIVKAPIITQYRQIKELSEFITDEKALRKMEESRSLTEGFAYSEAIGEARLRNALENIKSEVQVAFKFSEHMTPVDYDDVLKLKDKLDRLIPSSEALVLINEKRASRLFNEINSHFTSIRIKKYRKLEDLEVKNLSRVNIFAGGNNRGKTSILEAVYLLSQLNDINAFLDLERYRGKFLEAFYSKWLDKNFISGIDISGVYDSKNVSLSIRNEQTSEDVERSAYLSTIIEESIVGPEAFSSSIHLFANQPPEQRYNKAFILSPAAFTSPYRYNANLLQLAHSNAIKERYFDEVISFINETLDDSITKIDLISEENDNRFMVTSTKIDKAIDLTKYGEGLQRVFEIALLLGYCRNGILCIDEIDSAIHKNLLLTFTEFIQRIAERFNVQVFISTHSKECIDAFVENNYSDKELTAFALTEENGRIVSKYLKGEKLKLLVESINLDIR
jgi:AAA15 family ATPase/GTPase